MASYSSLIERSYSSLIERLSCRPNNKIADLSFFYLLISQAEVKPITIDHVDFNASSANGTVLLTFNQVQLFLKKLQKDL